jgi:hypothetical protein
MQAAEVHYIDGHIPMYYYACMLPRMAYSLAAHDPHGAI